MLYSAPSKTLHDPLILSLPTFKLTKMMQINANEINWPQPIGFVPLASRLLFKDARRRHFLALFGATSVLWPAVEEES